ncbi:MAG: ABC transporter permease [Planctomycetes bacterium GWF2_41_51]|nr:MAG: ABC transporter permease [Planctomycetes bacterium GWF2_41_51]HBG26728.1 ABC transporter permease [Phycisphaerales bacterium]
MNLASRDIKHNIGRFILTTIGVGLLLMIVMGMGGIYRGLVQDATLLIDRLSPDLWVVQKDTRGPFAEISRIPSNLEDRILAVPGVLSSCGFVSHTLQRERKNKPWRITVQGLSWPQDKGNWLPIVAGRPLWKAHYEMLADESLKLPLGEKVKFGKDIYTVVGLTRAMSSPAGDGMAFFTLTDAQSIQFDTSGEATRLERSARYARAENLDLGLTQPQTMERTLGPVSQLPALGPPVISAVVVKVNRGINPEHVQSIISKWPDVSVYSSEKQRQFLLSGVVERSKKQLGLFRRLLIIVSAIIMALIIYTLTIDKLHDIAMLKLIGARNIVILNLILQQALLLGILAYGTAYIIGHWTFPFFPRKVVLISHDLWLLAGIVILISILSSLIGIAKALTVEPNEVLA